MSEVAGHAGLQGVHGQHGHGARGGHTPLRGNFRTPSQQPGQGQASHEQCSLERCAQGREQGSEPPLRYVTASLQVDYLAPTPMGVELELRGRIEEVGERKVVVGQTVSADGAEVARGRVVAVLMPDGMVAR